VSTKDLDDYETRLKDPQCLVMELLEKGEKETVLQYLDLVSKFRASDNEESSLAKQVSREHAALIAGWKREIAEDRIPTGAQWL
jgi:hypothetical protein